MGMNVDLAVSKYCELRERRSKLKAEYEAADAELTGMMEKLDRWLLEALLAVGGNNISTPHGTVYKTRKEYVNIDNFDAFVEYVTANNAYGMFEKRVSKTAVKEYMDPDAEGNYQNPPPPGIRFVTETAIGVRRK